MSLQNDLNQERLWSYVKLRGGFPIPLAGTLYWLGLAALGYAGTSLHNWIYLAAVGSGLIFPVAMLLGWMFRCDFMKTKTVVTNVLVPAFVSMLLFWPMAIAAWWSYPALVPLIIAIGLSLHWPVIGWSYGRTFLFSAHSVVRAVACFYIWNWMPAERLTLLPLAVAAAYLLTVLAILIDSAALRRRMPEMRRAFLD